MSTTNANLSVFITGAGAGIGRATALRFAAQGAKLFLTGRTESKLVETRQLILAQTPTASVAYATFDLADKVALKESVEEAVKLHGGISVVVANAGVAGTIESSVESWEEMIETNLTSVLRLTKLVEPHLEASYKNHGQASIIFISSVLAHLKIGLFAPYAASKHGLNGWTGSYFQTVQNKGIKVTTINPGPVDTEVKIYHKSDLQFTKGPSENMLTADQVAYTIVFAASFPGGGCPTEITLVPQFSVDLIPK